MDAGEALWNGRGFSDPLQALAHFDRALVLHPGHAPAMAQRALALAQLGRLDEAHREATDAITRDSTHLPALLARATIRQLTGDWHGALLDVNQAIARAPDNADAWQRRGVLHANRGNWEAALGDLSKALALAPDHPDARFNRASAWLGLGKRAEAIADMEALLKQAPGEIRAHRRLGEIHEAAGNVDAAVAAYGGMIQADNGDATGHLMRGRALARAGRHDAARSSLEAALERNPRLGQAHLWLGVGQAGAGQHAEALRDLDKAQHLGENSATLHHARGETLLALNDPEGARQAFRSAIREDPNHGQALYQHGLLLLHLKEYSAAHRDLRRHLLLDPDNLPGLVALGQAQYGMGRHREAEITLSRALERITANHPDLEVQALLWRAKARIAMAGDDQTRHAPALTDLDRVIGHDGAREKEAGEAYMLRGDLRRVQGDTEAALDDYGKALMLDGTLTGAWVVRGELLLAGGDATGALRDFVQALTLAPEHLPALRGQAAALSALKRHKEAINALRGLANRLPNDPDVLEALANTLLESGRPDAALPHLNQALGLKPDHAGARATRAKARMATGDARGALADAMGLTGRHAQDPQALALRATTHANLGDTASAMADFNAALALAPEEADILAGRGALRQRLGQLAPALADFTGALERKPDQIPWLEARAGILEGLGRLNEALADWDRILALAPGQKAAQRQRGILLASRGEYETALPDLEAAFAAESTNPDLLAARAITFEALREDGRLDTELNRWLAIAPNTGAAWRMRAELRGRQGAHRAAILYHTRAIGLDGKDARAYLGRGLMHLERAAPALAEDDFTKLLALEPDNAQGWLLRARARGRIGHAGALADMERAMELGVTGREERLWLMEQYTRQGLWEKALPHANAILEETPGEGRALLTRAMAHLAADSGEGTTAALQDLNTLLTGDPEHATALRLRGKGHRRREDLPKACADWAAACALEDAESCQLVEKEPACQPGPPAVNAPPEKEGENAAEQDKSSAPTQPIQPALTPP